MRCDESVFIHIITPRSLPNIDFVNGANSGSSFIVNYSNLQQGWGSGSGNISTDPYFVNASNDNYHLQNNSVIYTVLYSIRLIFFYFWN